MCYCSRSEAKALDDIMRGTIPDDALVSECCWRWICRVRGRHFSQVDPETWRDICTERGYLFAREDPRGF